MNDEILHATDSVLNVMMMSRSPESGWNMRSCSICSGLDTHKLVDMCYPPGGTGRDVGVGDMLFLDIGRVSLTIIRKHTNGVFEALAATGEYVGLVKLSISMLKTYAAVICAAWSYSTPDDIRMRSLNFVKFLGY